MKQWRSRIKEYRYLFLIGILALVFTAALAFTREPADVPGSISKNEAGQGEREVSFFVQVPGLIKKKAYTLTVPERTLSREERKALFHKAEQELEEALGKSGEYVVSLPETLADGQILVSYEFEPDGYIEEEGTVLWEEIPEKTTQVELKLKATMAYGQESEIYERYIKLARPALSEEDAFWQQLDSYFTNAFESEAESKAVLLPDHINGHVVAWTEKNGSDYQTLWLLCGLAAGALTFAKWEETKRKKDKRKQELLRQYPDMIEQLVLLLGAGMTVYGAWEKIVLQYRAEKKAGNVIAVQEEMLRTYYEIHDGVSESLAYRRFAERCELPPYRRLSGLLIQNLKKGSAGIREQLMKEAQEALEEKKSSARKRGEEAGTKLLLSMIILLFVVLMIVLMPVFLTM
ncbi:MAG: type II secretion system F family protein [Eubacterium sp.]|nr:type II secretion system F family protein [Eubacterium sp.]